MSDEWLSGATAKRTSILNQSPVDFQREADRLILSRYAPPTVLVNHEFEVQQFRGRPAPYLETPSGQPTTNLLRMAKEGLFGRAAQRPDRSQSDQTRRSCASTCTPATAVRTSSSRCACCRSISPRMRRVVCWSCSSRKTGRPGLPAPWRRTRGISANADRDAKLAAAGARIGQTVPAVDRRSTGSVNQELRAAHEEVLSSNEELQSTNEELETTKESCSRSTRN
jgi:two-component system CheB/CheR fusion protein